MHTQQGINPALHPHASQTEHPPTATLNLTTPRFGPHLPQRREEDERKSNSTSVSLGGATSSYPSYNKIRTHPDSSWIRPGNPCPTDPPTTRPHSVSSPLAGPYRPRMMIEDEQDRNPTAASSTGYTTPPAIRPQNLPAPHGGPCRPSVMIEDGRDGGPAAAGSSGGAAPGRPPLKGTRLVLGACWVQLAGPQHGDSNPPRSGGGQPSVRDLLASFWR
jgi:hypothetical protein